ncbi:hypothetical protein LTR62_003102 [Meristemomyces frigidus]|uniref:YDG domain-containing protein n=1 Tax=Meristemomyces frigidus TaxID=1508187 RepID=A0AAN7TQE1_9PEZI|nr:hypothetical protein LTR62_003102 [Meristemomyces frigidus]
MGNASSAEVAEEEALSLAEHRADIDMARAKGKASYMPTALALKATLDARRTTAQRTAISSTTVAGEGQKSRPVESELRSDAALPSNIDFMSVDSPTDTGDAEDEDMEDGEVPGGLLDRFQPRKEPISRSSYRSASPHSSSEAPRISTLQPEQQKRHEAIAKQANTVADAPASQDSIFVQTATTSSRPRSSKASTTLHARHAKRIRNASEKLDLSSSSSDEGPLTQGRPIATATMPVASSSKMSTASQAHDAKRLRRAPEIESTPFLSDEVALALGRPQALATTTTPDPRSITTSTTLQARDNQRIRRPSEKLKSRLLSNDEALQAQGRPHSTAFMNDRQNALTSKTAASKGRASGPTADVQGELGSGSSGSGAPAPTASTASTAAAVAGGLAGIGPIRKKAGTTLNKKSDRTTPELTTSIVARPPEWYNKLKGTTSRVPEEANARGLLESLKGQIKNVKSNTKNTEEAFLKIREQLHKLAFAKVSGQLLRDMRALHDDTGLPQIFDRRFTDGVKFPWDVQADAEELYNKWSRKIFETNLLRGIIAGKSASRYQEKTVDTLDPAYPRISAKFHGNGLLLNGQWWPSQLAAMRDGAHGATIAGISGAVGQGAYSCIMSGGHGYPDEDHGEWILYCGTDSSDSTVTEPTRRMLESQESGNPVRLIRSHNLGSAFAPPRDGGFRYDGLYKVVSHTNLDGPESTRQRHQFKLVRLEGQDPIRGVGEAKRPTLQELEAHGNDRTMRGR